MSRLSGGRASYLGWLSATMSEGSRVELGVDGEGWLVTRVYAASGREVGSRRVRPYTHTAQGTWARLTGPRSGG